MATRRLTQRGSRVLDRVVFGLIAAALVVYVVLLVVLLLPALRLFRIS